MINSQRVRWFIDSGRIRRIASSGILLNFGGRFSLRKILVVLPADNEKMPKEWRESESELYALLAAAQSMQQFFS